MSESIRKQLAEISPQALLIDGMDEALIGIGGQFNQSLAVYSVEKILSCLEQQGMTQEEAVEYFEFNIRGCWMGEQTPVLVDLA